MGASPTKNLGARHARGEVLVFLDSHVKPENGAIQRLVESVEATDRTAIVTPAIGRLEVSSWKMMSHDHLGHGYGMDLETFACRWLPLGDLRLVPKRGRILYETPALMGCAFAIPRDLYEDLRGFDPHMFCWGAEDLDLGLKSWLMGHPILHDPEAVISHRFQTRFENFQVPVEQLVANQLRLARKNFTESVWLEWADRCRERHPGRLPEHPEGLWARAWNLFTESRRSVETERASLLARRVHDEFWYARRFDLPWPKLLQLDAAETSTPLAQPLLIRSASATGAQAVPSGFSHYLNALDDTFIVDEEAGQATGNVITSQNSSDGALGHDTYDGMPILVTNGYTAIVLESPSHGTVEMAPHGDFAYTPDAGSTSADSFTYRLTSPDGLTDEATVNILHAITTDQSPSFDGDYEAQIAEDTAVGTVVITVQANDTDGDVLTYSVIGGNDSGAFLIDSATGEIQLSLPLDYESVKTYHLTVKATDPAGLSGTANVVIWVTDVNEPPVVPAMTFTIDDKTVGGTLVGSITAVDPEGEAIDTYFITEETAFRDDNEQSIESFFRIEKDSGSNTANIYVMGGITIEYATFQSFKINIAAYVTGGQFGSEWSTVNVQPTFVEPLLEAIGDEYFLAHMTPDGSGAYSGNVLENDLLGGVPYIAGSQTTLGVVGGLSPQHGSVTLQNDGEFRYTPNSGYTGDDAFSYEIEDVGIGQSSVATVLLNCGDGNGPPAFVSPEYQFRSLDMDDESGPFGHVQAIDPEGDVLEYSIEPTSMSSIVAIDQTGELSLLVSIISISEPKLVFNVLAADPARPLQKKAKAAVELQKLRLQRREFSVIENQRNGSYVGELKIKSGESEISDSDTTKLVVTIAGSDAAKDAFELRTVIMNQPGGGTRHLFELIVKDTTLIDTAIHKDFQLDILVTTLQNKRLTKEDGLKVKVLPRKLNIPPRIRILTSSYFNENEVAELQGRQLADLVIDRVLAAAKAELTPSLRSQEFTREDNPATQVRGWLIKKEQDLLNPTALGISGFIMVWNIDGKSLAVNNAMDFSGTEIVLKPYCVIRREYRDNEKKEVYVLAKDGNSASVTNNNASVRAHEAMHTTGVQKSIYLSAAKDGVNIDAKHVRLGFFYMGKNLQDAFVAQAIKDPYTGDGPIVDAWVKRRAVDMAYHFFVGRVADIMLEGNWHGPPTGIPGGRMLFVNTDEQATIEPLP